MRSRNQSRCWPKESGRSTSGGAGRSGGGEVRRVIPAWRRKSSTSALRAASSVLRSAVRAPFRTPRRSGGAERRRRGARGAPRLAQEVERLGLARRQLRLEVRGQRPLGHVQAEL